MVTRSARYEQPLFKRMFTFVLGVLWFGCFESGSCVLEFLMIPALLDFLWNPVVCLALLGAIGALKDFGLLCHFSTEHHDAHLSAPHLRIRKGQCA